MEDSGQISDDLTGQIYLTPFSTVDTTKEQTELRYVMADELPQMDQLGDPQAVTLIQITGESFGQNDQVQQLYQLLPHNCENQQIVINQQAQPANSSTISNSANVPVFTQLGSAAATLADEQISVIENDGQQYLILPNFVTLSEDQQISFQGQGASEPSLIRVVPADATDIQSDGVVASQPPLPFPAASMPAPEPPKQALNLTTAPVHKEAPLRNASLPRQPPTALQFHDCTPGAPKKTTTAARGQLQMLDIIPSFFQRTIHQQSEMAGAKFCKQCKYQAKSVEDMQHHLMKHKNEAAPKKKNDPPRKRKTRRKKKVQMIRTVAPKDTEFPATCPVCEDPLKTAAQHRKHIKWHKNDKPHRCNECGESFNKEHNLRLHKSVHNRLTSDSGLDKYECPDCTKVFNRMAGLKMHILLHAEEETFLCKECGDEFATEDDLSKHTTEHINEIARHLQDKTKGVSFIIDNPNDNVSPGSAITVNIDDIPDNFEDSLVQIQDLTSSKQSKQPLNQIITPHKCEKCEKYFQKKSQLTRHMLIHTGEKPHKCPTCGKAFNQKVAMQQHMMVHTSEKKFTCPHCPQTYRQRGNLNLHIKRVHLIRLADGKTFSCQFCPCIFKKLGSLNAHVTKYHSDQSFMVGKEPVNNLNNTTEKEKQQDDELQTFLSSVFDKPDGDLVAMETSQQQNGDIVHRAMEECVGNSAAEHNTSAGTLTGLVNADIMMQSEPFQIENMNMQQAIEANNMSSGFNMQTDHPTIAHQSIESANIPIGHTLVNLETFQSVPSTSVAADSVQIPSATINQQSAAAIGSVNLAQSSLMHDGKGFKIRFIKGTRHYICPFCQKEFRKPSDLTRHIRIHTMERPFKCKHCSRAFTVKSSLTSHIRSHLGIKPYRCLVCQKLFTTNSSLKIHTRLHTGAKPFGCPYCEKKFRTNGQRSNHICSHFKTSATSRAQRPIRKKPSVDLSHVKMLPPMVLTSNGTIGFPNKASRSRVDNDKPYKCDLCGKGFLKQPCLTQHGRLHSGERPYECANCKRRFISKGCLRAHLKTHANSGKFVCGACTQAFSTKGSLKRHAITHTKNRPFMCPYCKKMFKSSGACKKHIKIHRSDVAMMQQNSASTSFHSNTIATQPEPTSLTALLDAETTVSDIPTMEDTINSTYMAGIQNQGMVVADSTLKQVGSNMVQNIRNLGSPSGLATDQPPQAFLLSPPLSDHQQQNTGQSHSQVAAQLSLDELAALSAQSVNPMMVDSGTTQDQAELALFDLGMTTTNDTGGLTVVGQPSYVDSLPLLEGIAAEPQPAVPDAPNTIAGAQNAPSTGIRQTPLKKVKATKRRKYHGGKLIKVNRNKMYQCTGCEAVFTPDGFEEHSEALKDDPADMPFLCDFCCHRFASGEHYKSHAVFHGVEHDDLVYKCSKCGLGFADKPIQEQHQYSYCKEYVRPTQQKSKNKLSAAAGFQRPINSNKTRSNFIRLTDEQSRILSQTNPNLHMTVSERVLLSAVAEKDRVIERVDAKRGRYKPLEVDGPKHKHVCPHCPKSFYKQNDLVRHIRTHTGEKPFKCKTCGKCFTVKSYLITHEKMHSGVKQFHCHICDLMYASKTSLKVHMRLHTGGLPFKCPHCDERFRTSGHRKNHIATHFKQNPGSKKKEKQTKTTTSTAQQRSNPDQGNFLLSDVTVTIPEGLLQASDGLHLQWNGQTFQLVNAGKGSVENMTLQIDQAALQQALGSPTLTTSQDVMRTYTRPVTTGPPPNLVIQPISLPVESSGSGPQEVNVAVPASLAPITQLLFQSATPSADPKGSRVNTVGMTDPGSAAREQPGHKDVTLAMTDEDLTAQSIIGSDNVQPFNFELLDTEDIQSGHTQAFS